MRPNAPKFLALAMLAIAPFPAGAGTTADDLCSGDPCVIAGEHTLAFSLAPIVIDFGDRAVVLAGTLNIGENDVSLSARSFEISGAVTGAPGMDAGTGSLELIADNVTLRPGSAFSLRGTAESDGGSLDIFAFDSVTGTLSADASGGLGGNIAVSAGNTVELTANARVGDFGGVRLEASCSLTLLAGTTITASPHGFIEFLSGGTMSLAGTFRAGELGENIAAHRPDQPPPLILGASFEPDLIVEVDDFLAPCTFGGPTPTPTRTLEPMVTPTPTRTFPAPTATPSRRPPPLCLGDCDGEGQVTVDEIITMVNIALGAAPLSACENGDVDGAGAITVDEIVTAVNLALVGCPHS